MFDRRWIPAGTAVLVAASSSTASTPTNLGTGRNAEAALLSNISTSPVYVALGSSSVQAAVPTTATPAVGWCIPAGQTFQASVSPSTNSNWISAATSAGSAPLMAQLGMHLGG